MIARLRWLDEWKEVLAWAAGGLGVLIASFLATFPYGALHARIVAEVNRSTGMDVRVADWTVGLPLAIEWRNVTLSRPDWGPVQLAALQTRIGVVKALTGSLALDMVARQHEATPNAGLARLALTASSLSLIGPLTVSGQFQQVDLSKVVRRYVSRGVLTGEFSHRVESVQSQAGVLKGEGMWKAEVRDLAIDQIPAGGGRILSLGFTKISAGLVCRDMVCDVTELKGDGLDGSFTGEGTVTIRQPLQNSQLALTVTVVPGAGFSAKSSTLGLPVLPPGTPMTIKVVGSLAQPRIAL